MAEFLKFKTRKNGLISYRQADSVISVFFPTNAFAAAPPASLMIVADGLVAQPARAARPTARLIDPAVAQKIADAKKTLAEATEAKRLAHEAHIAALTPEQLAKRQKALDRAKAYAAKKKAEASASAPAAPVQASA